MTTMQLSEETHLQLFGIRSARAGNPKPSFEAWSVTFGDGDQSALAYRAYCSGFDEVRAAAWERAKRDLAQHRVTITLAPRPAQAARSARRSPERSTR